MSIISGLKHRMDQVVEAARTAIAEPEVAQHRIEICNSCEFLLEITRNCKKCGCFVDVKTKISHTSCPVKKW